MAKRQNYVLGIYRLITASNAVDSCEGIFADYKQIGKRLDVSENYIRTCVREKRKIYFRGYPCEIVKVAMED